MTTRLRVECDAKGCDASIEDILDVSEGAPWPAVQEAVLAYRSGWLTMDMKAPFRFKHLCRDHMRAICQLLNAVSVDTLIVHHIPKGE